MMQRCGLTIERMGGSIPPVETALEKKEKYYIERLYSMDHTIPKEELRIDQYWLRARI